MSYQDDAWTPEWAERHGWQVLTLGPDLTARTAELPAGAVIDTRHEDGARWVLSELARLGVPALSIHDLGLGLLPASVVVDGSIDPARGSEISEGSRYLCGPDYAVLDPSFARAVCADREAGRPVARVFVGLGGGCRHDFLKKVLAGIGLWRGDVEVVALPGFAGLARDDALKRTVPLPNLRWVNPGESVAEILAGCGIAITAGGLTAYEALAVGTPLIALSYDQHQGRTLREMDSRGLCIDLGLGGTLDPAGVTAALTRLDEDRELRKEMSRRGRLLVDGMGAERVASAVCQMTAGWPRDLTEEAVTVEGALVRP